jgi:hypothetical protein
MCDVNACDGTKIHPSLADFIPCNLGWEQGKKPILLHTGFNRCVKTTHQKKSSLIFLCYEICSRLIRCLFIVSRFISPNQEALPPCQAPLWGVHCFDRAAFRRHSRESMSSSTQAVIGL